LADTVDGGEYMNYGKAVEEVWTWREALSKELEKVSEKDQVRYINEKALEGSKRLGINCRVVKRQPAHA
jgi:hypothetical protein